MTNAKTEFKIPSDNLPALKERLAKLSKKAEKLCGESIVLTVLREEDEEILNRNGEKTGQIKKFYICKVSGPIPKINGWKFSAAVDVVTTDSGEKTSIVRTVPGESIPEEFRKVTEGCDHCGITRNRKTLYVLSRV
jgi:hypothetical protein